ncbi:MULTISPECIES: HAMP domain-containing sensor histidine kinase [Mesotoga]|jgi:two-component system sensor histidine kinase CssS|uniref:sensor histidine kinase n=1 Tax=Mesotoga TaxID=1184396 RepID=UPI00074B2A81|nr:MULTISPECIES: HAMP domain-containing sensor histidine kinase [Mesotoga]KUK90744.1 MAG: Signal transduction histidine kinase [Thermotogales bacterium 46_20]MCP5457685.1 HAMP domain-containing histidine kinase [Thermotogota bacterium]MCB1222584.1 HAMP domain-containing histidine kinase [Mesotoga sp.]PIJ61214.1 histidine kinase [Mesotoga sp. H07.pep.5.3]RLL89179.1 histidine kinase [Mesotoga sp. H07pep.5.4]
MRSWSLSDKLWLLFAAVLSILFLLLGIVFRWSIRDFFTTEAYRTIEYAQEVRVIELQGGFIPFEDIDLNSLRNVRDVGHIIVFDREFDLIDYYLNRFGTQDSSDKISPSPDSTSRDILISGTIIPEILPAIQSIRENAEKQTSSSERYETLLSGRSLFYVIRNEEISGRDVTMISYMWDTYMNTLSSTLFSRLLLVMAIMTVVSLVFIIVFSRYLTKPLKKLSEDVRMISKRNWDRPISLNRSDEIGELADSIENMRKSLSEQDREQQSMLQFISHELKTPVMVIRSYAQAIKDGIYPAGDLDSAIDVIDKEIQRMDLRVKDLLFITRLEYLSRHDLEKEEVNLSELLEDTVGRFSFQRDDIDWNLNLKDFKTEVNEEQLAIAIENILSNQIRYAKSRIEVTMEVNEREESLLIRFANDGEKVAETKLEELFKPFNKGVGGENGLGLSITRRIIELHGGAISIVNEGEFVATIVTLPI